MLLSFLMEMTAAMAITALLAESYGVVRRRLVGNIFAPLVLGTLFGVVAALHMHAPLEPFDGLIVDLRNVPIALAGAFLGWRGLLPCLAIAMCTRIWIGGVGMDAGLWAMAIAGLAGMVWSRKMEGIEHRNFPMLLLLALAMSTHLLAAVVLPHDVAVWFLTVAAGPILMINLITVPMIGFLLERENRRMRREENAAKLAAENPSSQLLYGPAFLREATNAFAAKPLGTFAGAMVLTPHGMVFQDMFGISTSTKMPDVDSRMFDGMVTHWSLAGCSTDGRILIPLTADELETVNRLRPQMRAALAGQKGVGYAPLYWEVYEIETPDPTDFLELIENAVSPAHQNWARRHPAPGWVPQLFGTPSKATRTRIFNPVEHDALFAKASFLIERSRN